MNVRDSHVSRPGNQLPDSIQRIDDMMRWEELEECVRYHTSMASQLWLPSTYYLMDDGEKEWQLSRGYTLCHASVEDVPLEVKDLYYRLENVELDQSRCPLRYCIHSLAKDIKAGAQAISARDRHVTVIICSQGRPTTRDGDTGSKIMKDFQDELELLSKLPVKIIVRLCTDTEEVRDMYNSMDSRFDCIDVLDDFWGTFSSFLYIYVCGMIFRFWFMFTKISLICSCQHIYFSGEVRLPSFLYMLYAGDDLRFWLLYHMFNKILTLSAVVHIRVYSQALEVYLHNPWCVSFFSLYLGCFLEIVYTYSNVSYHLLSLLSFPISIHMYHSQADIHQ